MEVITDYIPTGKCERCEREAGVIIVKGPDDILTQATVSMSRVNLSSTPHSRNLQKVCNFPNGFRSLDGSALVSCRAMLEGHFGLPPSPLTLPAKYSKEPDKYDTGKGD